jgi:signal transduction histidine kinase
MSIRLRLALWYGGLYSLVLLVVTLISYAFHTRGHFDDLDRALITSAAHGAAEVASAEQPIHLTAGTGGLEIGLRLYAPDGVLLESLPAVRDLPPIDPLEALQHPAGPPFDALVGFVPPLVQPSPDPGRGAFGLLADSRQRWRTYVLPVNRGGALVAYIEVLGPLGRLDASLRAFRFALIAIVIVALILGFVGGWATAGAVLRPVSRMVQGANAISTSRDFSRRVETPAQHDEIGELAATLNEMLASLEGAYRAEQRFVSDASHELRAPLTAIQANLELLERRPDMSAEERMEAIHEASREAHRLARLVADLLALARADAGLSLARQPVELESIVLDAVEEARHLTTGQQLKLGWLDAVQVAGNADRLKQLVLILLDNAIKYTPPGGQISVDLTQDATVIRLLVADSGVGIPAEALPHVFERFYRADPARARDPGGTGLGLPIARWIVEQHKGQISLTSTPGQGTTATVLLPRVPQS